MCRWYLDCLVAFRHAQMKRERGDTAFYRQGGLASLHVGVKMRKLSFCVDTYNTSASLYVLFFIQESFF